MSTQRIPAPQPSAAPDPEEKTGLGLSPSQILGGALAAMTAAFLGSRLSLAGTVLGAAVASVVAAVASTLYTASLRRTHQTVRTVFRGRVPGPAMPADGDRGPASVSEPVASRISSAATTDRGARAAWPQWRTVLVGALAAFALAAVALTGLELASGHSLSGGGGTTVTQVADGGRAPDPRPTADASSASASPEPSASPSAEPTPSATPTATPSASANAPVDPTPTLAPAPPETAVPTPVPSATAEAPSADPTTPAPSPSG